MFGRDKGAGGGGRSADSPGPGRKEMRPRAELWGGPQTVRGTGPLLLRPPGQGRWGQQDQGQHEPGFRELSG